jgi:hypothetical protein
MTNEFLRNAFVILLFAEGEPSQVGKRGRTGFGRSKVFWSGAEAAVYIIFKRSINPSGSLPLATALGEATTEDLLFRSTYRRKLCLGAGRSNYDV